MSALAKALIADLSDDDLDALAELLAPRLKARLTRTGDTTPTWLNATQAAQHLACTRDRLYDLVQLGKLTPRRDGRRLLFKRTELDHYLEASK